MTIVIGTRRLLSARFPALLLACALVGAPSASAAGAHRSAKHHRVSRHSHKKRVHHSATVSAPVQTPAPTPATAIDGPPAQQASGACANAATQPTQENIALVSAATICLVNQVRAGRGLAALTVNATLDQVAQPYALRMVEENFLAHITPGGQTPVARLLLGGYLPNLVSITYHTGENIGWGTGSHSTPAAVVDSWVHSPEHLANMLNGNFLETGIGISPAVPAFLSNGMTGATYVEEFGAVHL